MTGAIGVVNRLDGMTILRYANAYDAGGGVEVHLQDLNRELGRRNRLTVVQMQRSRDANLLPETTKVICDSRLVKVPLLAVEGPATPAVVVPETATDWLSSSKQRFVDGLVRTRSLNRLLTRALLRGREVPHRPGEPRDAGTTAAGLLRRFRVDLVVLSKRWRGRPRCC